LFTVDSLNEMVVAKFLLEMLTNRCWTTGKRYISIS
jgi:hypothetical protein